MSEKAYSKGNESISERTSQLRETPDFQEEAEAVARDSSTLHGDEVHPDEEHEPESEGTQWDKWQDWTKILN
ncbi:hypothetical protein [Streptomyces griseorubiginosus]|uniref:hypothetical protein n=1 Tax=Streptomyces griseorubiginosus TaxID=67304 RepID=UPI001AD7886B|nr:hypothetical protein [Streptomyces griseorubiginosus]MBO4254778.1 hypothetical protein [Streptomyces griseorubiginosus]